MIPGRKFASWTVLELIPGYRDASGNLYYRCRCDCGHEAEVKGARLRTGRSLCCKKCACRVNGKLGLYAQSGKDLYIIQCGPYFKVGSSDNVTRRLKDMESGNPFPLQLLYHGKGEGHEEEMWHKMFEHRHHRREWFNMKYNGGCEV